jgi:SAM-dependent methyltransferase
MTSDNMPQVTQFWNTVAYDFDAIYSGRKSRFARALDRILRKDIYDRLEWVLERSGDIGGESVCDIGCGSGRYMTELAARGAARVVGVDVAPEMLKIANTLTGEAGVAHVCEFVHSDVLNWQTDEQFDLTIAIGFWDYIADPASRLDAIRRITKGRFLSAWPRFWTWRMPIRKVRLSALGCPVYFYRRDQVTSMLERHGFVVDDCRVVGKLFCVEARPADVR